MNTYLNWIKNNQYELIIALYLITLYISHHTFSPNLYWFRNITSLLIFRLVFLGIVLYALYHLYVKRISLTSRLGKLITLLVIALLLTEYHAHGSWEMFDNGDTPAVFIKKSGENLFLTISGDTATLSQGANGDLTSQIWTLSPGIGTNITLGSGDKYLTSDFGLKTTTDMPQWSLETVSNDDIDATVRQTDESQVANLTGPDQKPCSSKEVTYIRLKMNDGYLTSVDGQLKLENEASNSNIWYLFKCFPTITTSADTTPDTTTPDNTTSDTTTNGTVEGFQTPINDTFVPNNALDKQELKLSDHLLNLQIPNLQSLLNQFHTDSPEGKAFTPCTDNICGFDLNDKFQTV